MSCVYIRWGVCPSCQKKVKLVGCYTDDICTDCGTVIVPQFKHYNIEYAILKGIKDVT